MTDEEVFDNFPHNYVWKVIQFHFLISCPDVFHCQLSFLFLSILKHLAFISTLFTGGYYLTSAYGAMALIKNFQEEQAARVLSSEARNTLHQWHCRRTAQRSAPSVDDFQVSRLTWTHLEHPGSESKSYQFQIHPNLSNGKLHASPQW